MNIGKLYELATTQAHIGSSIPQGVKQNVFKLFGVHINPQPMREIDSFQ
jgi:hypothetical protein